jgi:ketosteroid isomerase-like protein
MELNEQQTIKKFIIKHSKHHEQLHLTTVSHRSISSTQKNFNPLTPLKVSSSDHQAITALLHSYGSILASRSLPDLLNIYTPDGVLMAPGYQPAFGTEALKSSYERIFSFIKLEIEFTIDEIVVMEGGEWAFARTTAEGRKFWLQRGTDEEHLNQELFVLRKVEGEWKIARYCFSSMKPVV